MTDPDPFAPPIGRLFSTDDTPTTVDDLDVVELDGELVVFNPTDGRVHHLDRVASTVWPVLDGTSTVGDIIDDLADAFGVRRDRVAGDVIQLLAELDSRRLLVNGVPPPRQQPAASNDAAPVTSGYLADPPSPCDGALDSVTFATPLAVEIGDVRVGVWVSSEAARDALARSFRVPVEIDPHAPANIHVRPSSSVTQHHLLHRAGCLAVATPDPERLVVALGRYLGALRPAPEALVVVNACPVVVDGEACLVPSLLAESVGDYRRRLVEGGGATVDAPVALVDLATAELVVPQDDIVDSGYAHDFRALFPPARRSDTIVAAGRYPLKRWLFLDWFGPTQDTISRADAVRRASAIVRLEEPRGAWFEALGLLFDSVRPETINPDRPGATVDFLLQR